MSVIFDCHPTLVGRSSLPLALARQSIAKLQLAAGGMGVNPPGHELPTWPIAVFLFTAVCALSFSAVFHLCFCNSEHVSCALARFDYAGIGMLIVGSTVPAIYYSMFCQTEWVFFYLSVSGSINVMTTLATFSETMALPQVGFRVWLN